MTAAASAADTLFAEALAAVRAYPLAPDDRQPAFQLPRGDVTWVSPGHGPVDGLPDDLWSVAAGLRSGHRSVNETIARSIGAITRYADRYHAFEHVADVTAVTQERVAQAARGDWVGPLHGIPVTIKDIIDVAGMPTAGSSAAIDARIAPVDATAVARLRAAGAVIMGKVVTHEFALGVTTPQSHNPWNESRVPGGSSGGSAISVLTGMALASLGTDTRASIRVPPAVTGLVGYRPSRGLIPVDHWLTLSWTMDEFGPIARSVRDIALFLDVLSDRGEHFRSLLPGSLAGRRVAYSEAALTGAEPGVRTCFEQALGSMERAGARVTRVEQPAADDLMLANAAGMVVSRAEALQFHRERGTRIEDCTPEVRDQLRAAAQVSAADYLRCMRLRGQLHERLSAAFDGFDLLAMPTSRVTAPLRAEAEQYLLVLSANCIPWSFVDFPAVSLFAGLSAGLPVGLQLVARSGDDDLLLAAAHAFERIAPEPPMWSPQ